MLDLDLDCVDRLCVSVGAGCAHLVACLFAFCCGDYGGGGASCCLFHVLAGQDHFVYLRSI